MAQGRGDIVFIGTNSRFETLRPVIGVAGEDLLGAIDLFGDQRAHQQVGPGDGAERHHEIGQQSLAVSSL